MAFLERHRRLLNAYVAAHPASLDGALAPLLATPRLLDLHNKARHFRARMRALQAAGRRSGAGVAITVNRRSTFEDSFRQLKGRSAAEMRGPLNVRFRGEEGIDAGALPPPDGCLHTARACAVLKPRMHLIAPAAARARADTRSRTSRHRVHVHVFRA